MMVDRLKDEKQTTPPILEGSVEKPLNREPAVEKLVSSFITESDAYDRNHGPIPLVDRITHRVDIDGAVAQSLSFGIEDLANSFRPHEVTCALQCAGNRRHTMRTQLKEVDGIDWGDGAVMNCRWRGPRLRDVLQAAGVEEAAHSDSARHVSFSCYQTQTQEDTWYGASIDLARALSEDGEVILALEMNGKPLTPNHGAPVRVIVPGVAGARSVKWLDRITVQDIESTNHYQRRDYKVLPEKVENAQQAKSWWDSLPAMQDMPINSVISHPRPDSTVTIDPEDGTIEVTGYALPHGSDGPIIKVEVSTNGQETWTEAKLDTNRTKWSWTLWKAKVKMEKGAGQCIVSRATDTGGSQQPATPAWNLRGIGYNGYGESRNVEVV